MLMRGVHVGLLLGALWAAFGCSGPTRPPSEIKAGLVCSRPYVTRGDSARITLRLDELDLAGIPPSGLHWSVNFGTLRGEGTEVTYVAPDTTGAAVFKVLVETPLLPRREVTLEVPVFCQIIVIKADDLVFSPYTPSGFPPGWQDFLAYIEEHDLKAAVGVIGDR
ncbi:MAG: hypothetical protein V1774_00005, partial [Candidatus Eisenbacteria bacterium]